ncbi:3-deoxy-manno-octulosonate cytidylyltransferase, partial [Streptomyces sp. SID6648]|nr:3-deoxy-manno-octulosonate cytidylyltransferase [Streptomyces sp. SID6648]
MAATTARPTAARRRRHIAVIPCRWGASRFPGKPLALLGGMPLLW